MASDSSIPNPLKQQPDPAKETYYQWGKRRSGETWGNWKPWMEDQYLRWRGTDNKASYATRDTLAKTKVPGTENTSLNKLQDDTHDLVAGQVGKGGLLEPVGDAASKEGFNRAERGGKDDNGGYLPGGMDKKVADPIAGGVKGGMDSVKQGLGYIGGVKK